MFRLCVLINSLPPLGIHVEDSSCTTIALWVTYLPLPLSLLTEGDGSQSIHISPEAFTLASAEFADSIEWWQDSLPSDLKGRLAELSGSKVLRINGKDPWEAVNANTLTAGSYQAFATRQNGYILPLLLTTKLF